MPPLFTSGDVVRQTGAAVLYGAGRVGREACRVLMNAGVTVHCMLDQHAQPGSSWLGVPIHRPDACPLLGEERSVCPLVLSIFNRDVDIPALALQLHALGFGRVVSFVDLHAEFFDALGDHFWLTGRAAIDAAASDIAAADRLWADDTSRNLYRSIVAFRTTGAYTETLRPGESDRQYLPSTVPAWPGDGPHRFVDCGAYRGDTLEFMLDAGVQIEASAHFEPDLANFAALSATARRRANQITGPIGLWPCAVSDRLTQLRFAEGQGEASALRTDGNSVVTAVSLDDVLINWSPTLIKMDIEGAELDALTGARNTIANARPSLAVCVYHRPDHLWRAPLSLSSWLGAEDYGFFLRSHAFNGFDTVLYAVPNTEQGPSRVRTS